MQTAGAVTIYGVVAGNYRFLKKFNVDQFAEAAYALQALSLGEVISVGKTLVFIKRSPSEAAAIFEENGDLCSPEYYAERYKQPLSRTVSLGLRHHLAVNKLVPKHLLM